MQSAMTRRMFTTLSATAAGGFFGSAQSSAPTASDTLQSEFLLDMVLDPLPPNNIGSVGVNRVVVPVAGGVFDGPQITATVVGPSGDWILGRPDGSSLLDVRIVLQTDDAQKIYVTWRGINYTPPGGAQYARILPLFETGATKYAWLNHIVSVGVYKPTPGKVAYRVYRIL
jgi:Protein of unknown function (DUF3237)